MGQLTRKGYPPRFHHADQADVGATLDSAASNEAAKSSRDKSPAAGRFPQPEARLQIGGP